MISTKISFFFSVYVIGVLAALAEIVLDEKKRLPVPPVDVGLLYIGSWEVYRIGFSLQLIAEKMIYYIYKVYGYPR